MGVGNFFGMLPDSMQNSRLYGVELDSITGRIAQKLYPQADITAVSYTHLTLHHARDVVSVNALRDASIRMIQILQLIKLLPQI